MMPVLASTFTDLLTAIGVGLAASVAVSVAVTVRKLLDERQNRALLTPSGPVDTERAAVAAEEKDTGVIRDVLASAVADVAVDQKLAPSLVRGSLFQLRDGSLRMLKDQSVGFGAPDEALIRIQLGETGVGEAAEKGNPIITVFRSPLEESTISDPEARKRINPALRWIISIPILEPDGKPFWVMAIDGLVEPRTTEQLHSSVARLLYYREIFEMLVNARGRSK